MLEWLVEVRRHHTADSKCRRWREILCARYHEGIQAGALLRARQMETSRTGEGEGQVGFRLNTRLGAASIAAGLLILLAYWALFPTLVRSQDTDVQRYQEIAGAYEISMALVQSRLSLGTTILAITVVEASIGQPVPDARVLLKSRHEEGDEEITSIAHNTPGNPDRYDAAVDLDSPGTWHMSVEVDSSLGRVSVEMAQLHVPETRRVTGGTFVFIGVFAVIIAGAAYLWWSAQRGRRRRDQDGGGDARQPSP